ncbi:MAG TPA: TIGR02281 family clan AA aspartic protease [Paracoccaceae bacterium]|nr:TIGR02281 family clan AA aspartic protease [Paracoccaceae bacterium]
MDGDNTARLIYLSLLLIAVGGSLFTGLRQAPGKTIQQLLIWAFIFLGLIAAYGLWPDLRRALNPSAAVMRDGAVELRLADDGHYYADTEVNGVKLRFLIDTGASDIVLSEADAERIGLNPSGLSYTGLADTANGTVSTAPVRLDSLVLGPWEDRDLAASVNGGDLTDSLMGMSYLTRYDMSFSGQTLRLSR